MASGKGINGLAVAAATAGAYLVYAGIKDVDVIEGLRDIASGKNPSERAATRSANFTDAGASVGTAVNDAASAVVSVSGGPLVAAARSKLGAKYVWGSVGPNTFDCSGIVIWSLRQVKFNGGNVPRFTTHTFAAWARAKGFIKVGEKNIRAGDIVLKSGHMGIAISNTEMIHAPHAGTVVKIGKIYTPRYMWSGWRMP